MRAAAIVQYVRGVGGPANQNLTTISIASISGFFAFLEVVAIALLFVRPGAAGVILLIVLLATIGAPGGAGIAVAFVASLILAIAVVATFLHIAQGRRAVKSPP